ncbi:BPSS1780 family membrane protein [Silvimonas iriomotensis]|uniref:Transmembrane protein n=1 Tax=Silvimonas iriomotensis TaxID=449662 RepID=A0ABQ2PEM7_9NEIS|nr:BPSS1780 family membrane protein [Silvimonas iriomotensis]GGP23960.1 hypothetical protein GCM10010970_39600 [Silvimonas iriomotensis]
MDNNGIIIDNSVEPRRVPAAHGWTWIADAFRMFFKHWWQWLLLCAVMLVILFGMLMIPVVGMLTPIIAPMLIAGIAWAAHESRSQDRAPALPDLFIALKAKTRTLISVGLLYMLGSFVVMAVLALLGKLMVSPEEIQAIHAAQTGGGPVPQLDSSGVVFVLLFVVGMLFMNSIYFFAPQLVILRNLKAVEAMRISYLAFWRNWLPMLVSGLILVLMAIVASLPMMLGLILLLPVTILFNYTCYADVFGDHPQH